MFFQINCRKVYLATNCAYRYKMKKYTDEQLKALSSWDWVNALKENPELADECDKWAEFDSEDWWDLLSDQPYFADRCDKVNGWAKFDFNHWNRLLSSQPQLADRKKKCEMERGD